MRLRGKIILKGLGLHTGRECEAEIEGCDSPEVLMNGFPLRELSLSGTNRGSDYIFPDGSRVKTCEHVLSALAGLGFWSGVNITVRGGEMPALDGCSREVCNELLRNSEAEDKREALNVREAVSVYGEDTSRFVAALPYDGFRITYIVEYKFIGAQVFDYTGGYYEDISCARTFAMASDIEYLRSHGMALGGSLDNAIVVGEEIQAKGGLHWPDEFVRHKVLDLIGDLAAVGRPVNAHIIAVKAGHELHLKLAEKLRGA
ncbi:MAG: UDP-3-O-acyl-N-acetylglucosamine deacetylase [Synergistaceae bacterium]|nr:UDP-3-O-acyl-N-acetylglucosamine deacetylase [Synergistaceae bacterium]